MSHEIRRRPWALPPAPHWEAGYGPMCDVCGRSTAPMTYGEVVAGDGLCPECRKAVQAAREQRAYLASLRTCT